jgi:hypothetical protein
VLVAAGKLTGVLLLLVEELVDALTDLVVGDLDVVLGGAVVEHEGEETVVSDVELGEGSVWEAVEGRVLWKTHELVLATGNVGDVHVVGGGRQILELLAGEDVNGDQVDLGVTVLAGLGGRHVDDLAGTALDDDVAVLSQGRTLHGVGGGGTGIGGLEGVLLVLWDGVVSMLSKPSGQPRLGVSAALLSRRGVVSEEPRRTAELSGEADVPGRRCRPF